MAVFNSTFRCPLWFHDQKGYTIISRLLCCDIDNIYHYVALQDPSPLNAAAELSCQEKWSVLAVAEEAFYYQRSRVTWLEVGDCNTPYFHRMSSSRQAVNHIHFIEDAQGSTINSPALIQAHCVEYFSALLAPETTQPLFAQEDISSLLNFACSDAQQASLAAPFSNQDIKDAFFSLPRNKASGLDGYSSEFFTSCWTVVGGEVSAAVSEFFVSGKLLTQLNATNLVLIPKIPNAKKMSDFRPISCLNTIYKVIAKLLSERLKSILQEVISHSQSAFMPGRLLSENVLLATEIVHGYNKRNVERSAMLKVDLRKAFDSVRWDFVIATLRGLNIPSKFINWISQCLTTPSFSILVNGQSCGYFKSTQGLRQGDPLSPYLFVLAMEVFSGLLATRYDSGYIAYHPQTHDLRISHLMFADDVMIFFDGGSSSLHGINETLEDFAGWSGLHMNRDKTQLFHAGLNQDEITAIQEYGFPTGSLPIRYLGLPLMSRKLKISEYSPLLDKITSKFQSWAAKSLSFAGRCLLISTVINGTVIFWTSTFILPKGCIKRIESLCARFLWSGKMDQRGHAKVAWTSVCTPKSEGGLGLRSFAVWNRTVMLKLIWLLYSSSGSLWVAWHKFHHCANSYSFWSQNENQAESWNWRCILRLRELASRFLICRIGNGESASFWYDAWTPMGPLINVFGISGPRRLRIPIISSVKDACANNVWNLPSPRSDQEITLHAYLTTVTVPSEGLANDEFLWATGPDVAGPYSSSKTWDVIRPRSDPKPWAATIWFKGAIPKHAFNMWVANLDRLPTKHRLVGWGMQIQTHCCLCSTEPETRDHLLISCSFSAEIWTQVFLRIGNPRTQFQTWLDLLHWLHEPGPKAIKLLRLLASQAVVYSIWRQRNNVLHNQTAIPSTVIFKEIDRTIRNLIHARKRKRRFQNIMIYWLA